MFGLCSPRSRHDFKLATINVEGGTASNLVIGVPFTMLRTNATDAATTYRPHPSEGMYEHTLAGVPQVWLVAVTSRCRLVMMRCIISIV